MYWVGVGLILLGAALWFAGRRGGKRRGVQATHGSIAIGGSNAGNISNVNTSTKEGGGHGPLTILAVVIEVIGITVTIWHILHTATK